MGCRFRFFFEIIIVLNVGLKLTVLMVRLWRGNAYCIRGQAMI